jgi:hypothetical protein
MMRNLQRILQRLDSRGTHLWGPGLLRASLEREAPDPTLPVHLYVCVADHFEPRWRKPSLEEERRRVQRWTHEYPLLARRHTDSFGHHPVRTLFFPVEEYRPEHLAALASVKADGFFDVEIHLHHENDTADNLRSTLTDFAKTLYESHGCLRRNEAGVIEYAFIHGNWALDNSHPEGIFCGVDNEISVLVETGCYMDMTLPCVPSPAQTRVVNTIYYARGKKNQPRAHDTGRPLYVGGQQQEGELLLVPGPMGIHTRSRAKGIVPRIEAAMLEPENPVPMELRVASWVHNAPAVKGAPNHRFIKLHAHGCNATAPDWFLTPGGPFDKMLTVFEDSWSDTRRYFLHYVTARQMYETIKRLEKSGP